MTKLFIALSLMIATLGASASVNRAVKISSKVVDGTSITRIFNGSFFATICRGEITLLTANDEVVVRDVKKLVVGTDSIEHVVITLDQEIIDSKANLVCEL